VQSDESLATARCIVDACYTEMKLHNCCKPSSKLSRNCRGGFVISDLLVAGSIAVLLVALAIGAKHYADEKTLHLQTCNRHGAILFGLGQYFAEKQSYPVPAQPGISTRFDGRDYLIGGSAGLYQALHQDGNDLLINDGTPRTISDGEADMRADGTQITWLDFDGNLFAAMVQKVAGYYVLMDSYGRPFQYQPAAGDTVNTTFDVWSFGTAAPDDTGTDLSVKNDKERTARWVKNWGQPVDPVVPAAGR
jgi:hypothetical protein